ncbi:MAG: hypothetical protein JXR62_02080 [Bacilli bacterium]|nr:hypothetical protein [Bacilli bacterium]
MKKAQYEAFKGKDVTFQKKATLYRGLYGLIIIGLFIAMFAIQALTHLITFLVILVVIVGLYYFVFKEYVLFLKKQKELKRIDLHQQFTVGDEVVAYFDENSFQHLYDDDFELLQKNDVFVIATRKLEDSIYDLALAVYLTDLKTEAVCPTLRELSREMSSYIISSSVVKVILVVANVFTDEDKELLQYDAQGHKNTVIIGLEKESKTLYYNYFLNGGFLDDEFSKIFNIDVSRKDK